MNVWVDKCIGGKMYGWTNVWMDGWKDKYMGESKYEWNMYGWTNVWVDECTGG